MMGAMSTTPRTRRDRRYRRRLTLSHDGRPFLDRWGLCHERFGGFYLHRISGPDPGLDVHDHPWSFVSIILSGGYTEVTAAIHPLSTESRRFLARPGIIGSRFWRRFSVHRLPLGAAHRIVKVRPGTWTLVLRGPTRRRWGFYVPLVDGDPGTWVEWSEYDYATRRPSTIHDRNAP